MTGHIVKRGGFWFMSTETTRASADEATVVQLAMFHQRIDAVESGATINGVSHPTWDELGGVLDGQETYLREARRTVAAMRRLGWKPKEEQG